MPCIASLAEWAVVKQLVFWPFPPDCNIRYGNRNAPHIFPDLFFTQQIDIEQGNSSAINSPIRFPIRELQIFDSRILGWVRNMSIAEYEI